MVRSEEFPMEIEKTFKGAFDNEPKLYASHLPVGTILHFQLENNTEHFFAKENMSESYKVYQCEYYNDER